MTYSVKDVAARLGVSDRLVLAWIAERSLVAVNCARKAGAKRPTWRITQQALDHWLAARTSRAATPPSPRRSRGSAEIEFDFLR